MQFLGLSPIAECTVFFEGTRLESCTGRYMFVWWKSIEKQFTQVKDKLKSLIELTTSVAPLCGSVSLITTSLQCPERKREKVLWDPPLFSPFGRIHFVQFSVLQFFKLGNQQTDGCILRYHRFLIYRKYQLTVLFIYGKRILFCFLS